MNFTDRDFIVELVKAAGREIIDRAEDIVGSGNLMTNLNIWIRIPSDTAPTIEVSREHISGNSFAVLLNRQTDEKA